MTVRIAVPNKGRLNERAVELLQMAGIDLGMDWGRRLNVKAKEQDLEILFVRAQDIPEFIAAGSIDLGITGEDMVAESGKKLLKVLDLEFGHCRLSVAAPDTCPWKEVSDIPAGTRIATSFPYSTEKFFKAQNKKMSIVSISGAAEIMPYLGISDIIVDLVASGSTLRTNRLVELGTILESQACIFVANKASCTRQVMDIVDSINSVIMAEGKKYLMANVPKTILPQVQEILPGLGGPTVLDIAGNDKEVAIQVVVDNKDLFRSVNELKKLGGKGILTLSIDRLVE